MKGLGFRRPSNTSRPCRKHRAGLTWLLGEVSPKYFLGKKVRPKSLLRKERFEEDIYVPGSKCEINWVGRKEKNLPDASATIEHVLAQHNETHGWTGNERFKQFELIDRAKLSHQV